MSIIREIQAPVSKEMKAFTVHFREVLKSDVALLDTIMRYIVKRKGKQMRPLFVFLVAQINGGCTPQTNTAASSAIKGQPGRRPPKSNAALKSVFGSRQWRSRTKTNFNSEVT